MKGAVPVKIRREINAQRVEQIHQSVDGNKTFQMLVQSQTYQLKQQEVQHLMNRIIEQGERLSCFRSFPDLVKFKRLVTGFLEKTVHDGLELQHSFEERSTPLAIVKEVDQKLMELTESLINQEKKSVDLLEMIGEIKGLLIHLYM